MKRYGKAVAWILTLWMVIPAAARTPGPEPCAPPDGGMIVHRDLAYAPSGHRLQKLDLYLPGGGERLPLILHVHGGAFLGGDKSDGVPLEYVTRGYAVASINYRLSGDAVFPAQIEDCKAAVRWLRSNASKYGLDPDRFAAWGASAGGHLSALLGTAGSAREFEVGGFPEVSSKVQAVVDYYGPSDFLQMDGHRMPDGMVHDPADSPESRLIGGAIQENREKVARANPVSYITKNAPPFLIVHGDSDPLVPHHQSVLLAEALSRAGVAVVFYTVKGGGHGNFSDPEVPRLTERFLAEHLKPFLEPENPAGRRGQSNAVR